MILTRSRYVLKTKDTGEVFFVVVFSLIRKDVDRAEQEKEAKDFKPSADDVD